MTKYITSMPQGNERMTDIPEDLFMEYIKFPAGARQADDVDIRSFM